MAQPKVQIVETAKFKSSGAAALVAFPGVGMSGNMALSHIIEKLEMKEVGHIIAPEGPHVVLIHKNRPAYPIRIYAGEGIVAILSELPVMANATDDLNEAIIKWLKEKKVKALYLLGGFPNPQRGQLKKAEVYAIPDDKKAEALVKKLSLKPIKEGAVFGEEGLLLLTAMEGRIPAVYILADSFVSLPDLDAAASLIDAVNKLLGKKIDNRQLKLKGGEIRDKFNAIMDQTKKMLEKQQGPAPPEAEGAGGPMYR